MPALPPRPLTLPELAEAADVEYRTLHTWIKRGLIAPSVYSSTGSGSPNLFSVRDALAARILADLRKAGLDLDALERAARQLREHDAPLERADVIAINGKVLVLTDGDQIAAALSMPYPALLYRVEWAWDPLQRSEGLRART